MSVIAIVGTDTGVGKTLAARALVDELRDSGRNAIALKPFVAGRESGRFADLDALDPDGAHSTPARYDLPLSPYGAIRRGEPEIPLEAVRAFLDRSIDTADEIVVEGIGGVMVPLDETTTWLDFHEEYRWPSIVVGRAGLGTISHTLLTIGALRERGISVIGFILSASVPTEERDARENAVIIERFSSVPCLASISYSDRPREAWRAAIATAAAGALFSFTGQRQ